MPFWRVVVCLATLVFLLASPAAGADNATYSGIPGKFRRSTKADQEKAAQEEARKEEEKKGKVYTVQYTPGSK